MDVDAMKKAGAVASGGAFVLAWLILAVLVVIDEDNLPVGIVFAVILVIISIVMAYYVRERLREIDEGLEDAIDDY